jgi:hypothetical protein
MPLALDEKTLTQFGVRLEDEGAHGFDPAVAWWNESWFWDWYDQTGTQAGHLRLGIHPNQNRAWVWLFLFRAGEWVAVEEPRLPLGDLDLARLAYDRWGLRFSWDVKSPLHTGTLCFDGFGRVLSGPRTGSIVPVGIVLEIEAQGPPHSGGRAQAAGHASQTHPASRFEQPIGVRGEFRIGADSHAFEGRGERDHSWGPRHWNLEWTFLVLNGERLRMQCAEAIIPNVGRFAVGYLQQEKMQTIEEATFGFELHADVLRPVSGRFSVRTQNGGALSGEITSITGAEIDITHTFVPPRRSLYRRALVRVRLDDGGPPLLGWVEFNRFDEGASR